MTLRNDLISTWETGMIFQAAVGSPERREWGRDIGFP
jgi:hypothetical protein